MSVKGRKSVVRRASPRPREAVFQTPRGVAEKVATAFGEVDPGAKIITNSARGTYATCRRLYWLQYRQLLAQRGVKHYFFVGGAYHKELETMYLERRFDVAACRRRIEAATKEALNRAATSDQTEKIVAGAAVAMGMAEGYASLYLKTDLQRMEFPELERPFGPIPIPGTEWSYAGVRDGLIRWAQDDDRYDARRGDLALAEHKSTAQMDANYFARLPVDNQILGYLWSMRQEGGEQPKSVLYNVGQKSRLRQKKGEGRGQFLDRVVADYKENPSKYFYREKVIFSPKVLDSFEASLRETVRELEWCIENGNWSMNDRACTTRGMCEMFPLCSTQFKDKDMFLLYERKERAHQEVDIDFDED